MTAPQSPQSAQQAGPVLGEVTEQEVRMLLRIALHPRGCTWDDLRPAVQVIVDRYARSARADGVEEGRGDMEQAEREWRADERERIATALETRAEFGLCQWVRDEAQRQLRLRRGTP